MTTSQILNLTALSAQTRWISCNDVITRHTNKNENKSLGLHFDNFLKIIAHIKTNHDNANGFYGVKGSW